MRVTNVGGDKPHLEEERDLFEMAHLYPRTTGLANTVWVSPRGGAKHDIRVKVSVVPGDRMSLDRTAVIAVRPTPALLHGTLPPENLDPVLKRVSLNTPALVDFWNGVIDAAELIGRLQRV